MPLKIIGFLKIPLLAAAIVAPILLWLGLGSEGFLRLYQARQDRDAQREINDRLSRENRALMDEINRLETDMAYLETIARKELSLVKENEIIYRFEKKEKAD
ncbi:Septum formation initiator [uncultured Desulfatiglans sp.]|uniref:Septum formation initiator n=1 Tax=Uncultured Desulfatiglans sp. TaxID=1748965 RepID=A0A653A7J5_UNCDX|nr:Septum formation initiator [uncultured Desulfatiglans sp.]